MRIQKRLHVMESPLLHGGFSSSPLVEVIFEPEEFAHWKIDPNSGDLIIAHWREIDRGQRTVEVFYTVKANLVGKVWEEEIIEEGVNVIEAERPASVYDTISPPEPRPMLQAVHPDHLQHRQMRQPALNERTGPYAPAHITGEQQQLPSRQPGGSYQPLPAQQPDHVVERSVTLGPTQVQQYQPNDQTQQMTPIGPPPGYQRTQYFEDEQTDRRGLPVGEQAATSTTLLFDPEELGRHQQSESPTPHSEAPVSPAQPQSVPYATSLPLSPVLPIGHEDDATKNSR